MREGRQAGNSRSTTATHRHPSPPLRPHPLAGCAAQAWSSFWTPRVSCWEWCACAWALPLWGAPPLALSGAACGASRSRRGAMGWQRSPPAGLLAGSTHCLYRLGKCPACSAGLEAALAIRQSPAATNKRTRGPACHALPCLVQRCQHADAADLRHRGAHDPAQPVQDALTCFKLPVLHSSRPGTPISPPPSLLSLFPPVPNDTTGP